ncbi:hypothetical protein [Bradyrhizobium sp. 193]|uniref:hypothetical protein n=1 Tax=Bradyrhizobium sp. 193 TaxID=2782661 RepID=UPI001FFB412D|nr:hypothetical protein [Bradyrhizobium sp. 193]
MPNADPELESKRVKTLGNVSMMIYGNYGIRAAATAMQDTSRRIIADRSVQNVCKAYSAGDEIFRIQNRQEVKAAEARFLR